MWDKSVSNASDLHRSLTHLDVACPPVEVQMAVLDLSKICKFVQHVLFRRFFVHICDEDDPSFDCYNRVKMG